MKISAAMLVVGAVAQEWRVTHPFFSALTLSVDFKDDQTGWTTFSSGSGLPKPIKSEDGGATWHDVESVNGTAILPLAIAATDSGAATSGPLFSSLYSLDGDNFQKSVGGGFDSQDLKFQGGRLVQTTDTGICISTSGGESYTCKSAPLKYGNGTARYSSSPEEGVIYLTAGSWPQDDNSEADEVSLSRNVRLNTRTGTARLNSGKRRSNDDNATYTFELLKSVDDGETWTHLMSSTGDYYPNDIHCYDATHCVMVAEGFPEDGSQQPGGRVFYTSDGNQFDVVHVENNLGTESLVAARMISPTEYWVGGAANPNDIGAAALLLHSADGGQSHENKGDREELYGEYVQSFSFVSADHGWAVSLNGASTCNMMEFGGSTPPAPTPAPPTPGSPRYEKPPCQAGEKQVTIDGIDGTLCSTPCYASGACPEDKPDDVSALPTCALSDSSTGGMYCALLCLVDKMCDQAGGATCNGGICTYNGTATGNQAMLTPVKGLMPSIVV